MAKFKVGDIVRVKKESMYKNGWAGLYLFRVAQAAPFSSFLTLHTVHDPSSRTYISPADLELDTLYESAVMRAIRGDAHE